MATVKGKEGGWGGKGKKHKKKHNTNLRVALNLPIRRSLCRIVVCACTRSALLCALWGYGKNVFCVCFLSRHILSALFPFSSPLVVLARSLTCVCVCMCPEYRAQSFLPSPFALLATQQLPPAAPPVCDRVRFLFHRSAADCVSRSGKEQAMTRECSGRLRSFSEPSSRALPPRCCVVLVEACSAFMMLPQRED